jgi:1-deoxy-D-xylulose-5-phosphate reductoisomerase
MAHNHIQLFGLCVLLLSPMNKETSKKRVAILGSTGSIGTQALEVIAANPDMFEVELLTANGNFELLAEQAALFQPNAIVIHDTSKHEKLKNALSHLPIKVWCGAEATLSEVQRESIDVVLTAMVGFSGLLPTITAIKSGKHIALANKETLVVAGELITDLSRNHQTSIIPVDSEHSAIFQCLVGEWHNPVEKIILTASGGPFRGKKATELAAIKKEQALKHPNWTMGRKITIDSATLMNKGLEVIEAKWLFNLKADQIEVIVHPQSIIHSLVQFTDGSMKAQLGLPDMKLPIQYALGYPQRMANNFPRFDFSLYPTLTFEKPDTDTFTCLQLAYEALKKGGNLPCVLNAANEIAVERFLNDDIGFNQIPALIEAVLHQVEFISVCSLDDYIQSDLSARQQALSWKQNASVSIN